MSSGPFLFECRLSHTTHNMDSQNLSIEEKFKMTTERDRVLIKDMHLGPIKVQPDISDTIYVVKEDREKRTIKVTGVKEVVNDYSPASLKTFDEIFVNAIDQAINEPQTTKIEIFMDSKEGKLTVKNNGPGIPIVKHKEAKTWLPQFIFGVLGQGSNFTKAETSITGGTNGIGAKATNIHSSHFSVETVSDGKKYYQTWANNMDSVEDPIITTSFKAEYTIIEWILELAHFGYTESTHKVFKLLKPLIMSRIISGYEYLSWARPGFRIYFNDCKITGVTQAQLQDQTEWYQIKMQMAEDESRRFIGVVNGIAVLKGNHQTKFIRDLAKKITDEFKVKIPSFPNVTEVTLTTIANFYMAAKVPAVSWEGQRKENAQVQKKYLSNYSPTDDFVQKCFERFKTLIMMKLMPRMGNKKGKVSVDKYIKARHSGTKKSHECGLFLPEGDSAASMISTGLSQGYSGLNYDYFGILTLGGVPMNAHRQSKVDGKFTIPTERLLEHEFFQNFMAVTGLKTTFKFDKSSPEYTKEMASLNYGFIVGAVDQDHDGIGKIWSLILAMMHRFWPNLMTTEHSFVRRFATVVARAYPKSKKGRVHEFFSEHELTTWLESIENVDSYEISYIKGLATHGDSDIKRMFKKFHDSIFVYRKDTNSEVEFEKFYGSDPEMRKEILGTPLSPLSQQVVEKQMIEKVIRCTHHLYTESKNNKLCNLGQKLWNACDGMNESGRKILAGSLLCFRKKNKIMRVDQLAGFIAQHMCYHHGAASLEDSIKGKAFLAVGGVQLPQLVPLGSFGSRAKAGKDAGAARYIRTKLNKKLVDLIYPEEDMPLLDYVFSDGQIAEPKMFIPTIPMAVLESTEMPADGWKIKVFARDVFDVIERVIDMINVPGLQCHEPKIYDNGFTGNWRLSEGKLYGIGKYEFVGNRSVRIYELPLRFWPSTYSDKMFKKEYVDNIDNRSAKDTVLVELDVNPEEYEKKLSECGDRFNDPNIEALHLYASFNHNLNMMSAEHTVISFEHYEDVINYWFEFRKNLYKDRVDRELTHRELELIYLKSLYRFLTEEEGTNFDDDDNARTILLEKRYEEMNPSVYRNGKIIRGKQDELLKHFYGPKKSFDYLLSSCKRDFFVKNTTKLAQRIAALENELSEYRNLCRLGRFPGAEIWKRDLRKLEKIIREGVASNWTFGEDDKLTYDSD